MPITWFEPIFPYNLIYDLGTYSIFSLIFIFLYKIKILNKNLLYFSLFFLLTPFFFNGLMFNWAFIPDQSKYLFHSYHARDSLLQIFNPTNSIAADKTGWRYPNSHLSGLKFHLPAFIYALSPILSLETYKGIAICNRTLFLLTWIFFYKKKFLDEYSAIFFLLAPSMVFYSSVALRDILIILLMFWFIYFHYQNKKIISLFLLIILFYIKFQLLVTVVIFIILDQVIRDDKIKFRLLFLIILLTIPTVFFLGEKVLQQLNFWREGFYLEEFGRYTSMTASKSLDSIALGWNIHSIGKFWYGFINFIIPPFLNGKQTMYAYMHLAEVALIIIFLYFKIKGQKNFNKYVLLKWFLVLFISYALFSTVVFNSGSALRYKVPIMFFVIFGYINNVRFVRNK